MNIHGVLVQGEAASVPTVEQILASGDELPLMQLHLRDLEHFVVGGIHENLQT